MDGTAQTTYYSEQVVQRGDLYVTYYRVSAGEKRPILQVCLPVSATTAPALTLFAHVDHMELGTQGVRYLLRPA